MDAEKELSLIPGREFAALDNTSEARKTFFASLESDDEYRLRKWLTMEILDACDIPGPQFVDDRIAKTIADRIIRKLKGTVA